MVTQMQIELKLKDLLPVSGHKYKVKKIGFFGSFLHGTPNQDSDIEILVDFYETPGWDFFD